MGYATGQSSIVNCHYRSSEYFVEGSSSVGGIVGRAYNTTISNCYNRSLVKMSTTYGYERIGGIAGYADNSTVSNCYSTGHIKEGLSKIGGVVGEFYSSTVTHCYFAGYIDNLGGCRGGIVGYKGYNCLVTDCIYDSTIYKSGVVIGSGSGSATNSYGSNSLTSTMKNGTFAATLGSDNWVEDTGNSNDGYPVLKRLVE